MALVLLLFFFIDESQYGKHEAWNSYSPARVLGSLNHLENLNFSFNVSVYPYEVGYFPDSPTIREIMQLVNRSTILPGRFCRHLQAELKAKIRLAVGVV